MTNSLRLITEAPQVGIGQDFLGALSLSSGLPLIYCFVACTRFGRRESSLTDFKSISDVALDVGPEVDVVAGFEQSLFLVRRFRERNEFCFSLT